jgi:hypothetical protein
VVVPVLRVADIPLISVLGFLVMFFGVMMAVTSIRQGDSGKDSGGPHGSGGGGGKQSSRRSSFTQRMEERFRQRFEEQ